MPPGTPPGAYGPAVSGTDAANGTTLTESAHGATATVEFPAGALPTGTEVFLAAASQPKLLGTHIPTGQAYIVSFAVSWRAPDGTSPEASSPITIVVTDPSIKAGDVVYMLTSTGLQAVGTATADGHATITFRSDPDFVLAAAPHISAVGSQATVHDGSVSVRISCTLSESCTGTAKMVAEDGRTELAVGKFRVAAGRTSWVRLGETLPGKRFLNLHRSRVVATVSLSLKGGGRSVRRVVVP